MRPIWLARRGRQNATFSMARFLERPTRKRAETATVPKFSFVDWPN